jgi:hypothetical protein
MFDSAWRSTDKVKSSTGRTPTKSSVHAKSKYSQEKSYKECNAKPIGSRVTNSSGNRISNFNGRKSAVVSPDGSLSDIMESSSSSWQSENSDNEDRC